LFIMNALPPLQVLRRSLWKVGSLLLALGLVWISSLQLAFSQEQAQAPLTLSQSKPAADELGVPVKEVIQFQFNQALPENIQDLQITTEPNTPVFFDIQGDKVLIQSEKPWAYSTDYTVTLPPQAGLNNPEPIQLKFRTEPQYTYNRDIQPLADTSCVGCHGPAGRQRGQLLNSYEALMAYVTPGKENSVILDPKWTGRHGPLCRVGSTSPACQGGDGGGSVRAPEIAYARQKGYPIEKLGLWNAEEIDKVKTWIVQDQAVEDLKSPPPGQKTP
jgi:methionine-rich copper-binding protein CopC